MTFDSYQDIQIHNHFPPRVIEDLIDNTLKSTQDDLVVEVDKKIM